MLDKKSSDVQARRALQLTSAYAQAAERTHTRGRKWLHTSAHTH